MKRQVINHDEREKAILEYLASHAFASTEDICAHLGVSLATVRRDFTAMNAKGLIHRSRGGVQAAVTPSSAAYASSTVISTEVDAEKAKIAAYAASLVNENDSIFIGSGKTCNLFASYLKNIDYLNVVTTSLNAVVELIDKPNITVYLLGGDIHAGSNFIETLITDNELEHSLASLYFDKVFITVDGADIDSGYTIRYRRQIPLYTRLLESSRAFYLLLDSSKFACHSFVPAFQMEQIRDIVTTTSIPEEYADFYRRKQVNLHII